MQKISKINVKLINKNNQLGESSLEYNISGDNINYIVTNTIRRIIFEDIPIYAFNEFKFEKNNSIFHNTYMKRRLEQLPVWGIENTIDFLENTVTETKINNEVEMINGVEDEGDDVELDVGKTLNSSTLKQLTMYVNYKNKTNDVISVTTDDAKFYFDEKQIKSPYSIPIPLVKLQGGQEIVFSAITNVGTEKTNAMYSAVTVNYYKENKENDFDVCIESRGQLDEMRILEVAFINIKRRLNNFKKLILDEDKLNIDKTQQGVIIVNNEDHTFGNLISKGMQQHKNISSASYSLPHPLANKVHFHFKLEKGNDIKKVLEDVVEYYIELFDEIKKQIKNNVK